LLMFACTAVLFAWAASDFREINMFSLRVLMIPAFIGAVLAAISIGPKLGKLKTTNDIIWRAAAAFGAAGFAWPLSFAVALLLQGNPQSAAASLLPALAGLVLGAIAGAASGAAAAHVCLRRV